jgi:hypothetical protein
LGRVTSFGSILPPAAHGFFAAQGFLPFAAQGLHGLRQLALGAQGEQGAAANATGKPITAPASPDKIAAFNGLILVFMGYLPSSVGRLSRT